MKQIIQSKFFSYGVFWSWNLLYIILFASLEINTGFVIYIIRDAFLGLSPVEFIFTAILAYCVPIVSIILGLTIFRNKRDKLITLFYAVEVPLTLFLLLRLFLVREMHMGTLHLFILFVTGMLVLFYEIVKEHNPTTKIAANVSLLFNSILLVIGSYVGLLLVFYLPPALVGFVMLLSEIRLSFLFDVGFLVILSGIFILYTMTLFLGLPVAFFYYYYSVFEKRFLWYTSVYSKKAAMGITGTFVLINMVLFYLLNWNQSQNGLLDKLNKTTLTKSELREFAYDAEEIKEGLLNAYLSKYRYLGEESRNHHIEEIYKSAFGGKGSDYIALQVIHNALLKPFLYEGESMREDSKKASEVYEQCFDASLQKSEKGSIKDALKSTWERDGIEAGLLNIDEKKVHCIRQSISIKDNGGVKEVELHEIYENQTFNLQEILYYFSLPEHAAITGIWISDSNVKKFPFQVSPRGAAQEVYKEEVKRRIDPSLLEQVGPQQYRLRAFPIPGKTKTYDDRTITVEDGKPFHLWFSYQVIGNTNNTCPLPVALQRRNVYCDESTEFLINGEEGEKENDSDWLPRYVYLDNKAQEQKFTFSLDGNSAISATPFSAALDLKKEQYNLAFVIDQSFSVGSLKEELEQTLERLEDLGYGNSNVYLTGLEPEVVNLESLDVDDLSFWGNSSQLHSFHQFDSLRKSQKFDGVVLLTDQGDYEISEDSLAAIKFDFPVYMIHMDGKLPYAYDDELLETLQASGGKSFLSIEDMLYQKQLEEHFGKSDEFLFVEGGYLWTHGMKQGTSNPQFEKLAAHQYIKMLSADIKQNRLETLDSIHAIAKRSGIVTPYSSMIVLVNDIQKELLDKAEKKNDRFDREVEDGKETMSSPSFSLSKVSGTPEPEEWVLIIFGSLIILYSAYKKYLKKSVVGNV